MMNTYNGANQVKNQPNSASFGTMQQPQKKELADDLIWSLNYPIICSFLYPITIIKINDHNNWVKLTLVIFNKRQSWTSIFSPSLPL